MWKVVAVALSLALAVPAVAEASEPVLVPDFASGTSEDWVVTNMVQGLVVNRLVSDGHIVITSEVAGRVVTPDRLVGCGPSPSCPQDVLPSLPARLAVVVTTGRQAGALAGHVELFLVGQGQPTQVADLPVVPGNEQLFAAEVARLTGAMLQQIGPSPDGVLMAAARLIAGQPVQAVPAPVVMPPPVPVPVPQPVVVAPPPVPRPLPSEDPDDLEPLEDLDDPGATARTPKPVPAPGPQPVPTTRIKKGDGSSPHEGPLEPILEGTGVHARNLLGSEASFRKSGLDPRDWMFRAMPHAGRLIFQVSSGLAIGDVERTGVFLVERTAGNQTNTWFEEGPASARRVRGEMYIGYAPATMFDFGVAGGLQYGGRTIVTGVIDVDSAGAVVRSTIQDPQSANSVEMYVSPRVRGYLVPLGPAKPYLFTGADFRIFDSYDIAPNSSLQYLVPPSAVTPGWIGGGGIMIDPSPIVGVFAEGSYTRYFGPRSLPYTQSSPAIWDHTGFVSPLSTTQGIAVVVSGGVQFRL
jgi:hypothetical protein